MLHRGEVLFLGGYGFADTEKKIRANEDTIYCIASCTKAFTSATCARLVHDGKLSWTEPVSSYLPEFRTIHDPEVGKRATLLDICSHGTGLAPLDHVGCGFFDEFFNPGDRQVQISANLAVCYDFRSRFLDNNFMLGLAGEVIKEVSGSSAGATMKSLIFEPLGLTRTGTSATEYPDSNVAKGYSVLDNGELLPLSDPKLEDGSVQGGAGFVRSTARDMLAWAKSVIEAERAEVSAQEDATSALNRNKSGLVNIAFSRSAQRPITYEPGGLENSYALGWFRHMLPSKWLGSIGPNFTLLPDPPLIGKSSAPRLAIAHYGEFSGFLTSFYTFPETCSAIIVMANSSPSRGDPTDLIAQHICQELFNMAPRVDFVDYARKAARNIRTIWPQLVEDWVVNRVPKTQQHPIAEYIGTFSNEGFAMTIEVFELSESEKGRGPNPELMGFRINSLPKQVAKLRHYHYDVWSSIPDSRDDAIKKGMEGFMRLPLFLLSFKRKVTGEI